jgi:hypothetical protein
VLENGQFIAYVDVAERPAGPDVKVADAGVLVKMGLDFAWICAPGM